MVKTLFVLLGYKKLCPSQRKRSLTGLLLGLSKQVLDLDRNPPLQVLEHLVKELHGPHV